jgi:pSer/pThr/pTyr-binding forkhead associated (FHA) protein
MNDLIQESEESTNGTRVNGKRAQKAPLKSGDDVQLGKLQLRVDLPA